jgi:hypothetical protein
MGASRALAVLLVSSVVAEPDEAACRKLGFAPSLLCSACDKLGDFVGTEDALIGECRECCTEEVAGSGGTYAHATLDVCK